MKVAIYSGEIPSTTFIENLIHAVADQGYEVLLFGSIKGHVNYARQNIRLFPVPSGKFRLFASALRGKLKLFFSDRNKFIRLKEIISGRAVNRRHRWVLWSKYVPVILNKPDIFHLQWARNVDEWLFLKEILALKLVVSLRGSHITYAPQVNPGLADMYKKHFPGVDGFHAVSESIAQSAALYGARKEAVRVVYSAVDERTIGQKGSQALPEDTVFRIISIGRMQWVKGYHYAIDAMQLLRESGMKFHYTLVGWGDQEEVRFLISDSGLEGYITVTGRVSHDEVFRLLRSSDLMFLPSVEEGVANAALEAMAMGIPVLSSNCGGMPEVISNGKNGFLFRSRNPEDMARMIRYVHDLPAAQLDEVNKAAKGTIAGNHSLPVLGKHMGSLYEHVLAKNDAS